MVAPKSTRGLADGAVQLIITSLASTTVRAALGAVGIIAAVIAN
jgi:hypothetical protein